MTLILWFTFTAVFAAAGYRLAHWLTGDAFGFVEKLAVAYLLSSFGVYLGVFAIGPFFLDYRTAAIVLGALAVAALFNVKSLLPAARAWRVGFATRWAGETVLCRAILVGTVAAGLASLLQGLAPPNTFDSMHYHLPLAKHDIEVGRMEVHWLISRIFNFFPQLMGHQSRLFLMLDPGAGLTQLMHGNTAAIAAIGAAGIAARCGLPTAGIWLAAAFVIVSRVVVWQTGSVELDVTLAAVVAMSATTYLAWRDREGGGLRLMVLFGFLAGLCVLVKYQGLAVGFAIGVLCLWDLVRRQRGWLPGVAVAATAALVVMMPHLSRNVILVGNPLFPLFNGIFNLDQIEFFARQHLEMGTGRSLWDVVIAPWMISIYPTRYFDGMIFGAPYVLALAPLALLLRTRVRHGDVLLILTGVYFIVWFYALSQQTRFLLPVLPLLGVFCAAGAVALFSVRVPRAIRLAAAVPVALLFCIQSGFAGIYALIRLPPALGLVSAESYLDGTPTMDGGNYGACKFVENELRDGERYLLFLTLKFYCPLAAADNGDFSDDPGHWMRAAAPSPGERKDAIRRLIAGNYRFLVIGKILPGYCETFKGPCPAYRPGTVPIAADLLTVLGTLKPVRESPYAAVFDGREVTAGFRRLLERGGENALK